MKLSRSLLLGMAVVAALGGGTAAAWANGGSPIAGSHAQAKPLDAAAGGLNYVPITPCRAVDTRGWFNGPIGPIQAGATMLFGFMGGADEFGGDLECYVPTAATAVQATITATGASGPGDLKAWPFNTTEPGTTVLSYTNGADSSTGTVLATNQGNIAVRADTHSTQVVIDVEGYYIAPTPPPAPLAAVVGADGSLIHGSSRVISTSLINGGTTVPAYRVAFDADVSHCAYQVTPLFRVGNVYAYPVDKSGNVVGVELGKPGDTDTNVKVGFSLTVTCF